MYGIFKREQSPANPVKEEIDSDHNDNDEEEYGDIEDSFKRELAEIKNTPRGGNRFRQVDLDVECLTFIQFLDLSVDPCTLTLKILKSIKSKNQGITRYTHRLLPVTTTCHTTIPSIIATATPLIDEHFKIEGKQEGIKVSACCTNLVSTLTPPPFTVLRCVKD